MAIVSAGLVPGITTLGAPRLLIGAAEPSLRSLSLRLRGRSDQDASTLPWSLDYAHGLPLAPSVSNSVDPRHSFFDMLTESQYWRRDEMRNFQRSQLRQLLAHARKNVPFYAERLEPLFRFDGSIDWDRWTDIPVVARKDLVEHRDTMQARSLPSGHRLAGTVRSSGSTGVPIEITLTSHIAIAADALRWRVHQWHGLDWSKNILNRLGDNQGPIDWPQGTPRGPWGPPWAPEAVDGFAWSFNSKVPHDVILDFLESHNCPYLVSAPKVTQLLAREATAKKRSVKLAAVLMHSGEVGQTDRDLVRETFGARLIEHYSSKEGAQMAHECPAGHLHVNAEACLLEIVDDDGQPCAPGALGRVVITPFFYTAQPLIRYDQGDLAVAGETCECGRTLPVLASIAGRSLAIFRHPDGRSIVEKMPDSARNILQCDAWQTAQVGPNDYEVRYVPRDWEAVGDEASFIGFFRSLYFADATVRLKRVRDLPLTAAGKMIEYVNEWQPLS